MEKILITVIIGLVVGLVIGNLRTYKEHGPDSSEIKKHIYHDNGIGCYSMKPIAHICPFS